MALIASGWRLKSTITKYILIITGIISGLLMQGITGMSEVLPYATILLSKGDSNNITRGNILDYVYLVLVISSVFAACTTLIYFIKR